MKRIIFISLIILFHEGETFAMEVKSVSEQLFFVTVRIETETQTANGNMKKGIGTGFIVQYSWREGGKGLFIVTNKHVIKDATKGRFFFIKSDGENPILGERYEFEIDNFEKQWFGHINSQVDVAVMPLGNILNEIQKRQWKIFFKTINQELIPTQKDESTIDAIEEIIFVGYPSGLFDEKNYLPIARKGTTATPYCVNYKGLPMFLVDAAIFRGSSGSPVFISNIGSYSPKGGGLVIGNRFFFLGIVAELYEYEKFTPIEIFNIPSKQIPGVVSQENLNLGAVFKSSTVFETIEALLKKAGEIK